MYMNLEAVLVIGAFALLATLAGWVRILYFGLRRDTTMPQETRAYAAEARRAYKGSRQAAEEGAAR